MAFFIILLYIPVFLFCIIIYEVAQLVLDKSVNVTFIMCILNLCCVLIFLFIYFFLYIPYCVFCITVLFQFIIV